MPTDQDFYAILGIDRDADAREIKRAYRTLARELHPDLPENRDSEEAAERFREVREAYEVLSDPTRKREYDIWGRDPFGKSDLPWAETEHARYHSREKCGDDIELATDTGQNLDSIFADLFSKDAASSPPPSGKPSPWTPAEMDRQARLDIAAEVKANQEARAEADRRASAARSRSDKGQQIGEEADPAGGGGGKGRFGFDAQAMAQAAFWGELDDLAPAPEAGPMPDHDPWAGEGADGPAGGPSSRPERSQSRTPPGSRGPRPRRAPRRVERPEPREPEAEAKDEAPPEPAPRAEDLRITVQVPFLLALNGGVHKTRFRLPDAQGRWTMEELDLSVPPGLEDGGRIRLPGKGEHGARQGQRGDLLVDVVVEDHPIFRREGSDVVVDLPLTPAEAAAGCRVEVPTLNGRAWVRVPPAVHSGKRIALRGFGLLDARTGRRGDQLLVALIQLPPRMGREEIGLLLALDERCGWDPRAHWWEEL